MTAEQRRHRYLVCEAVIRRSDADMLDFWEWSQDDCGDMAVSETVERFGSIEAVLFQSTDEHGPTADIDHSGNPYVDQFIHGRADGPIKMQVRAA